MMEEVVIRPKDKLSLNLHELKAYRELFFYFAWRDVKVRYKQSILGIGWAVVQPFAMMVVFTLFFNKVAKVSSGSVPYAIFSYSGLLFWNYFSSALTRSSASLLANQGVITKIYFPRIIVPISATIVALIDFFFAFLVFLGLMAYYHIAPGAIGVLFLIPAIIITFISASGLGMLSSAINVKYRDVQQIVPFLIQVGLFLTPVIYPISLVPHKYQWILYLNPMTGVINAMRAWWLHQGVVNMHLLYLSIASALALFVGGYIYFKAKEKEFADII
jgi:lipopolysaccharide transport system permease protein